MEEYQTGSPEKRGSSPACADGFLQALRVKRKITLVQFFSGGFMSYLRRGWSIKLWAIENCIFSIRSIERNMRPILRTVRFIYSHDGSAYSAAG